jgi:hypothetical protein
MDTCTCYFCKTQAARDRAIDAGWAPSFWDARTDAEVTEPVCPDCCLRELMFNDEEGDWERPIRV